MIKKLITLFKLGRKVAKSDILNIASKFKKPPVSITILFQLLSISFSKDANSLENVISFLLKILLIIIFIFIGTSALLYKFAQINILLFKFLIDGSSLIFSDNKSSTDKVGLLRFNLLIISKFQNLTF